MAPILVVASMATKVSIILGMNPATLSPGMTPRSLSAPARPLTLL